MRSAMTSAAVHNSLYCVSNIRCSVLNIVPVTFQWKLCVFRYNEYVSASSRDRFFAIASRSFLVMPMSMAMECSVGNAMERL